MDLRLIIRISFLIIESLCGLLERKLFEASTADF